MRRILVVSHGNLAAGLHHTAQMIMGEQQNITHYALQPGGYPEDVLCCIQNEIDAHKEDEYIILTDLLGGSICNTLMQLAQLPNIHVVSGMNVCMLLSVAMADLSTPTNYVVEKAILEAKKNIMYINELWERKEELLYDQNDED